MTHKILDHDTQKIIYRSAVRPKKSSSPNHRLAPHGGEVSASSDPSEDKNSYESPLVSPEGFATKQKAPTPFIRSRDEENPSGSKPMPFLHLLILLKIKFPLDHHLDTQKVPHRNRRPLQSSSGPDMKRIHLDPSLCLPLTSVT